MNTYESEVGAPQQALAHESVQQEGMVQADEMDWDAYAEHYDEMCALNPAYQENIEMLLERLDSWTLPQDPDICDLGAGTGNFILRLNQELPSARYWHVDFDDRMIQTAKKKYEQANLQNISLVRSSVHTLHFSERSFDIIVCINALYAFASQEDILSKMRSWLKPDGKLFLIDFGRKQRTFDWAWYIFRESVKARQIGRYARALVEGRELLRQNRRTTKGQGSGRYWLHSTKEFGEALHRAGFTVEELSPCYRGYSDFAVCSR